jgi:sulfur-oxidizing protein SoxZ
MKVKAKLKKGIIKAKVLFKHDMLTYNQAEKKGVKANFITHIQGKINGTVVYDGSTSQFLSKNPIVKFKIKGDEFKKGDKLEMSWVDLAGNTKSKKAKIK